MATTAEQVYQRLDEDRCRIARTMFLRMVKIGVEMDDTRRRLSRTELTAIGSEAMTTDVVDAFVAPA